MREIETDYLVVGAGASGMAFVDSLIASSDADVVMVDRRHRPGGHWLDAYPFVRIHQTSVNYGVNSRVLGNERIDETGPNAGFYERAGAAEICAYYNRVLEEVLLPSGQVRFFGMSDYRGDDTDGHRFVSLVNGEETTVKVRRKLVDATYIESEIPSRHTPAFDVDPDVRLIPPNDLIDLDGSATGYTVIGAGKTSMDTCNWLMDEGVAPDRIRWIRPREPWTFDRAAMQPLDLVGSFMQLQARWVKASAEAESSVDFANRLEADGIMRRIDPTVEAEVFRGAILSAAEIDALRQIENVVRQRRVRRIGSDGVALDDGSIEGSPHEVYVNCTAAGFRPVVPRPVFDADRITMQIVTIGNASWSAATLGVVEATREDDAEKNRLCPTLQFTGNAADLAGAAYTGMLGIMARSAESDLAAWNESSRLNPARGMMDHLDDPRVSEAFAVMAAHVEGAMSNLERLARQPTASAV